MLVTSSSLSATMPSITLCVCRCAHCSQKLQYTIQQDWQFVAVQDKLTSAWFFHCLAHHSVVASGAPVPRGADAVVQIENTEQLPDRQDGEKRIKIVKVFLQTAVSEQVAVDSWDYNSEQPLDGQTRVLLLRPVCLPAAQPSILLAMAVTNKSDGDCAYEQNRLTIHCARQLALVWAHNHVHS